MTTATTLITDALKISGVSPFGVTPSSDDSASGLRSLNDMLHGWAKTGIDLGHITLVLTDTMRVDDSYLEGIKYNLAARLASDYGLPLPSQAMVIAQGALRAFRAHTLEFDDGAKVDTALQARHTLRTGFYNIDEG